MGKKSFNDKLSEKGDLPKIVNLEDPKAVERFGGTRMLIAPATYYQEIMEKVPSGKVITSDIIRKYLAKKYNADYTCQLTAGIFINIVAHASEERATNKIAFWRTLKKDGELNEKYPGGIDFQKLQLEAEGHEIVKRGKRYFARDYLDKIFNI